jgi:uncharacterized protein (DUF362 family)/Pyruvate/2-oxoacid:ferredoxin oxidoreductase delta subunit
MNNKVSVRKCEEYDLQKIIDIISEIYEKTNGPDVQGKKVLLKPNILSDNDPSKCVSTHPIIMEAMIRFLQSKGATVFAGDSPAIHTYRFRAEKSGILGVCEKMGVKWINFTADPVEIKIKGRKVKIAAIINNVDLIISLPKFKNHELEYFTGAIKNTFGLIPGFSKAKQHAVFRDRNEFGGFLVDLNETIVPDYFFMDGIMGMEGPGPGPKGLPVFIGLLFGSTNPLVLDITASRIAEYDPLVIPTTKTALRRKKWLQSIEDIDYDGPEIGTIIKRGFKKIPITDNSTSGIHFVMKRVKILRKLERRPVFLHEKCTGCRKCVNICPMKAIQPLPADKKHIVLTDSKCIRCFCCAEACTDDAIDVRVKIFGA